MPGDLCITSHFITFQVLTLFVPGKMTADRRMKRIAVTGTPSYFRDLPERENPFHPLIRCHIYRDHKNR